MALKVKAKEKLQKIGKYANSYRYVMMPELYSTLTQDKVIKEAALRSGVNQGVMQACWDAAGEVIKAWAEDLTHHESSYHLHPQQRAEGRAEEHRCADYLLRPQR